MTFWKEKILWSKDISQLPETEGAEVGFAKIYLIHAIFCSNQTFLIKKDKEIELTED